MNGPNSDADHPGTDHPDGTDYEGRIALDRCVAEDLAHAVTLLEDWLLHTGDDVHTDLAHFAFRYDGLTAAVPAFIDDLGTSSVQLHRALRAATSATRQAI